jgi:chemotaxis methyl-accepting protein methylase
MTVAEIAPEADVERLAAAVSARIGLKRADLRRKIADGLAAIDSGQRLDFVERMLAAPAGDSRWLDFVERLLVHETYFFRHPAQLELLRDEVLPGLDARRRAEGGRALTVWSAACSTGEEAWTLALLAAAMPGCLTRAGPIPLSILASDVSEAALTTARAGIYDRLHGLDSFRAIPPWAAGLFFGDGRSGFSVPALLRPDVRFLRHNLLDPPPLAGADLVLCRNALIYFDEGAGERAQRHLAAALRPGGVLMLGPADTLRLPALFDPIETELATAYRKKETAS